MGGAGRERRLLAVRIEEIGVARDETEGGHGEQGEHGDGGGELLAAPEADEPGLELGEGDVGVSAHQAQLVEVFFRVEGIADEWVEGIGCGGEVDRDGRTEAGGEQEDGEAVDGARAHSLFRGRRCSGG